MKAMNQIAVKSKLELAQFVELSAFAQLASDLDKATRNQLARGQRLRGWLAQTIPISPSSRRAAEHLYDE